jgi:hypothetical protein
MFPIDSRSLTPRVRELFAGRATSRYSVDKTAAVPSQGARQCELMLVEFASVVLD